MTNLEVKCCEKCREDDSTECRFAVGIAKNEREVCPCHQDSPVSQSVEGWKESLKDLLEKQGLTPRDGVDEASHQIYDEQSNFFLTTLSTLVKKMEGKYHIFGSQGSSGDIKQDEKNRENMVRLNGFNAGISAAQEVVKKMV